MIDSTKARSWGRFRADAGGRTRAQPILEVSARTRVVIRRRPGPSPRVRTSWNQSSSGVDGPRRSGVGERGERVLDVGALEAGGEGVTLAVGERPDRLGLRK